MKRVIRRTSVRVVMIVASTFGAVFWTVDAVWSMQEPTSETYMDKTMKTVCVGRFLIDVPADAKVTLARVNVDGFDIVNYGAESPEQFATRVASREAEINGVKNRAGQNNMVSAQDVQFGAVHGKIFVFGFNSGYMIENGIQVIYSNVGVDGLVSLQGSTFRFFAKAYKPEETGRLAQLLKKLQPLDAESMSKQSGFCLDGAFLRDPLTADQGETIVMFAGLPGHDDLGIVLSTAAGTTPGPGLLERNAANRAGPYAFLNVMMSTLLQGQRTIGGLPGDEFAFKTRERNFTTGYAFDWEAQGTEDDVMRPFVSLELQTGISPRAGGEPVQSTLAEESLGDLWRRMSSSLRLRPVESAAADVSAERQLGLALGTVAWAGTPCRQTGWWQCGEADAHVGILGGARQFLREGAAMPQALLLPKPSVWQKVRGLQPSHESTTPTSWRLADKRSQPRHTPAVGLMPPVAPAAALDSALAAAAPGGIVRSGQTCTASGWWRCVDADALDNTRWFARGATLPAATWRLARGPASRAPQLFVRASAWQLMRRTEQAAIVSAEKEETT